MKKEHTGNRRNRNIPCLSIIISMAVFYSVLTAPVQAMDADAEARRIVETSHQTLQNFMADPQMSAFRNSLKSAKAVLIIPELLKAGILIAGQGGNAVFLLKDEKTGQWSYPYFYTMVSGSIGFQAGAKASEVMLLYMNQKTIDRMLDSTKFKLGSDATLSAGSKGGGQDTIISDILSYSRTKGLFGGLSVDGGMVQARPLYNKYYYGPGYKPMDILVHHKKDNPHADPLRDSLEKAANKGG